MTLQDAQALTSPFYWVVFFSDMQRMLGRVLVHRWAIVPPVQAKTC